jgi:hypothetical protein
VTCTLAIGPAHCDRSGWPSCYSVGYEAGKQGPCPSGHSAAFCAGWYVATYSKNNLGFVPPSQQPQIKATNCSQPVTQQDRYNCGYNQGYMDAQRDWNLDKGEDPSCPHATEHTSEYCNGYAIGYIASWNALLNPSKNYISPSVKFLTYKNSTYGIKMQYPSDWRVIGASNSSIVASFYPQGDYASQVTLQIENLSTDFTPDQYLNGVMRGDLADYRDFPDIRFTQNTTNNIVLAGHPGYLLNGTFRDPTSDVLQRFTNIGTIIGDKEYSVIYYSPAETYPDYNTIYDQMIKSFEVMPGHLSIPSSPSPIQKPPPSIPPGIRT